MDIETLQGWPAGARGITGRTLNKSGGGGPLKKHWPDCCGNLGKAAML